MKSPMIVFFMALSFHLLFSPQHALARGAVKCSVPKASVYKKKIMKTFKVLGMKKTISKIMNHRFNVELKMDIITLSRKLKNASNPKNKKNIARRINQKYAEMVKNAEMKKTVKDHLLKNSSTKLSGAAESEAIFQMSFQLNSQDDDKSYMRENLSPLLSESSLQKLGDTAYLHSFLPRETSRPILFLEYEGVKLPLNDIIIQLQHDYKAECKI